MANHRMFSFHDGGVQISCNYPETVQQLKMQLFKDREVLCDLTKTKGSGNTVSIKNPMSCPYQLSNNSVSFFLDNADSSQGSYFLCSLSIFDPPPFQEKNLSGGYLLIYGKTLLLSFCLKSVCSSPRLFSPREINKSFLFVLC